ncbi:MAG: hypothetical protein ACREBV_04185 [Candidatus Zixiibacteriota bacterium]
MMPELPTTVEYQSIVNIFRLCKPQNEIGEIGYSPLRLGVKTIGVKRGFYHELVMKSCRIKVSAPDMFRYLWRTKNQICFDVFSQN